MSSSWANPVRPADEIAKPDALSHRHIISIARTRCVHPHSNPHQGVQGSSLALASEGDEEPCLAYDSCRCFPALPRATRNITLLSAACGEKKRVTSSSKKVKPLAPRP